MIGWISSRSMGKMGYASAISWVLFAIVLVFTMFIFKSSDAWVYYEDGGDF